VHLGEKNTIIAAENVLTVKKMKGDVEMLKTLYNGVLRLSGLVFWDGIEILAS